MSHQEIRESRQRSLTEKGEEQFESLLNQYHKRYEASNVKLQRLIAELVNIPNDDEHLVYNFERNLSVLFVSYTEKLGNLCKFLSHYNTPQSVSLQRDIDKEAKEVQAKVNQCFENVKHLIPAKVVTDTHEGDPNKNETESRAPTQPNSVRSLRSSSAGSSLRSVQAQKRAKAEAAKAKLAFSEKEKELREKQVLLIEQNEVYSAKTEKEKSFIEAELKFLGDKKEATTAITEAEILEDAVQHLGNSSLTRHSVRSLESISPKDHVDYYVSEQNELNPAMLAHVPLQNLGIKKEFWILSIFRV
ncbi:uncharacterized protein LOC130054629 isoform X2 [Ostrea edulis]|uniref:uncharacterized protein LOC130054629 isoform X2 n=1 Tax=Ostrea edulis TaxID=37623 RepID=UPI0024AED7FB|nr:uncharacterized protein LOC130054629 isoform X2 [Ostrea edulis]